MDLARYAKLPDCMTADEIEREFERLLIDATDRHPNRIAILEAMCELADRQWHTYERANPELRVRLEKWFQANWIDDVTFADAAGTVAAHIGLPGVCLLLEASSKANPNTELSAAIQKTLDEIQPTIDDPYSGL